MMNDLDRIREALQFIPTGGHDERFRIGCMVKSELGDTGRDLWDEWRDGRGDDEAASVWKSISETGALKIGTLFHEAKANGWRDDGAHQKPSPEELAERRRIATERAAQEEIETARKHADAAQEAKLIYGAGRRDEAQEHPYAMKKRVNLFSLVRRGAWPKRGWNDALIVPLSNADGKLSTLQAINTVGEKDYLAGGCKRGCFHPFGTLRGASVVQIGEGMATVAAGVDATDWPAAAAMDAGNLLAVGQAVRGLAPDAVILFLADNDVRDDGRNPGFEAARAAAVAVGGFVAIPELDGQACDWWDVWNVHGADVVAKMLQAAIASPAKPATADDANPQPGEGNAPAGDSDGNRWPDPQPLAAKIEPEPYPLDALPLPIRAAVEEVVGFVKAPLPMVISSALGALSLACQAHVDVKRCEKLDGPVSLFLLTIGESGERKSTCDGFFVTSIREYQEQQAEAMKPELDRHQAEIDAWSAEREGLLLKIKDAGKKQSPMGDLRASLTQLQHEKPEAPRVPRLLLGDETPENLAWGLARHWPSAGVVSSEAGQILGAHGMGKDSVMRNLGLLNVLWEGGTHSVGRRTSESFTVKGARLTVALQIQEPTLRSFFDKSGALARGSGFLARFLVAWPESTQGYRPFSEAPANWPHLATFHRRIAEILNQPAPINEQGELTPQMLALTPDAKAAWIEYHDAVEVELRSGGDLHDVRDVASKSADNAVRLAALFHVFEHGAGAIGLEAFEGASRIAAWHLNESRRFFGELALPAELADAGRLDTWLIEYCRRERTHMVSTRDVQRLGPVRDKDKLTTATKELVDLDRVQIRKSGKRITTHVNPALIGISL